MYVFFFHNNFWVSMWKLEIANPSLCSAQHHGRPWVYGVLDSVNENKA